MPTIDINGIIHWSFNLYLGMIFIYVLLSWLPHVQQSPLGNFLAKIVEPYLSVFRQFIPPLGVIDLSPLVAILALHFIQEGVIVVVNWLYKLF